MRLAVTTLLIFGLIFPLLFCTSTAAPEHSKPSSKSSIPELKDIHPNALFKRDCENEVKENMPQGPNRGDDPSSQKCMLYCGFKKIGMLSKKANLNQTFLRNSINGNREDVFKQIRKCASKNRDPNICSKAMRNADCAFEHLNREWIAIVLNDLMK